MSRRAFQVLLLVLLSALITDEVNGIYSFKRAPNQFRKRVVQMPAVIYAWVSVMYRLLWKRLYDCSKRHKNQRTKSKQAMPVNEYVLLIFIKNKNRRY